MTANMIAQIVETTEARITGTRDGRYAVWSPTLGCTGKVYSTHAGACAAAGRLASAYRRLRRVSDYRVCGIDASGELRSAVGLPVWEADGRTRATYQERTCDDHGMLPDTWASYSL